MQKNRKFKPNYKTIYLAVATALPMLMQGQAALAACTTNASTDANTVTCTEGSSYSNAASSTVSNTAAISTAGASTSAVQMVGNGSTFNNAGTITNDSTYTNTTANAGQKYGAFIAAPTATTDAENTITNSGTISATISDANMQSNKARLNTVAVVGVGTDAEGEYTLNNTGGISATHNGVGRVNGVEAGGNVESMEINNSGNITGTQSHAITTTTSTATSFQGHVTLGDSSTTANASIGVAAGIYAEEEVSKLIINNDDTGNITGVGTYASGIYTRAAETEISNEGTITGTIGFAQVSDSGEIRKMKLDNSGTINGDILSVNGSALRWWSLSNGQGTGGADINSRLNINSQWGQADSEITNSGTITGNFYYSNGTHSLKNESGATITGNIDLDQRDTTCANCTTSTAGENTTGGTSGVSSTWTVTGTKDFTFENAGTFTGNITVRTTASSDVTLSPTITGSGSGSSLTTPSTNIAGLGSTFNLINTSGGDTSNITIKPIVATGVVIKSGEFFKVIDDYQINGTTVTTGTSNTPGIASSNSLISWSSAVNASGNLVVESNVSGANVSGASTNNANLLNNLLSFNSTLGSQIQNLNGDAAVIKAAEQLRPAVNNASFQAVQNVGDKVSNMVDTHLGDTHLASLTGKSGVATGEQAQNTGVWIQGYGFRGEQDRRNNVDGYSADAYGFGVGADTEINPDLRVGAFLSYGQADINDSGVNLGNKTEINSYQATLFSSKIMDGWYWNAGLSAAKHDYDTKRIVLSNVVSGKHEAMQYSAKIDAGLPFKLSRATLTPIASLAYSRLNEDGYSESGVGALSIGDRDTDSLRSGLGAKALIPLSDSSIKTSLELRTIWNHEFANTAQDTVARFTAGGSAFTTTALSPTRDSANLGAALRLTGGDDIVRQSLTVSYDAEIKQQYLSHTAQIQARFDF